ncbi:AraC family transcriptional regulator [Ruminococcus sp. OA3]|uniref:AraC family transcriptional regulator n=1 Tax=Ruminococcus sp. OA3 TaxID=2914164 RepID=UPI001F05B9E5|nr:AraC family transcriptional regulator [Ruminococcus sp. OA3]MCH1981699.1 AraC family transcriptional regulator [Ruminococcus sp. OA3]
MLLIDRFDINENDKEILPISTDESPFVCKYAERDYFINEGAPWHWHNAFEISYAAEGEIELQTPEAVAHIVKGDVIFVNSDVMHTSKVSDDVKIYTYLFDMHFLSGMYNSVLEQKYFHPILKCRDLQMVKIHPDNPRGISMVDKMIQAIDFVKEEGFGYEFEIRNVLSQFWCMLLEETREIRSRSSEKNDLDGERIKTMISFIHRHYMDRISVDDIARAASISKRECSRCFQRCIRRSPGNYLCDFRIYMAAQMLLRTNDTVTEICEKCGFSSDSYFGKVFRETMNATPRDYRMSIKK